MLRQQPLCRYMERALDLELGLLECRELPGPALRSGSVWMPLLLLALMGGPVLAVLRVQRRPVGHVPAPVQLLRVQAQERAPARAARAAPVRA